MPVPDLRDMRALTVRRRVGLGRAAREFVEAIDKSAEFVFGVGFRHNFCFRFFWLQRDCRPMPAALKATGKRQPSR
jgi:hypothetical protein